MLIKSNNIYKEDCITFMQKMRENVLVDVIVTSPPYIIGKNYGTYKDNISKEDYLNWLQDVAKSSFHILKEDGSFFLNINGLLTDPMLPFWIAKRFETVGYIILNVYHWIKQITVEEDDIGKNNGFRVGTIGHNKPINSDRYLADNHEYIFHFTKTRDIKLDRLAIGVPYQDKSNIGRYSTTDKRDRGNVWFIPYPTIRSQEERPHPATFPVKLPEMCIKLHGRRDGSKLLVYDPFMGSGSTALACVKLGVNYLGTDTNEEYIKTAIEEIKSLDKDNQQYNNIKIANTKISRLMPIVTKDPNQSTLDFN